MIGGKQSLPMLIKDLDVFYKQTFLLTNKNFLGPGSPRRTAEMQDGAELTFERVSLLTEVRSPST